MMPKRRFLQSSCTSSVSPEFTKDTTVTNRTFKLDIQPQKEGGFCLECMLENSFIQISRQMTDNDENLILWSHNSHWNVWNSGIEKRAACKTLNAGWLQEACWEVFLHCDTNFPLLVPYFLCLKRKKLGSHKWRQMITESVFIWKTSILSFNIIRIITFFNNWNRFPLNPTVQKREALKLNKFVYCLYDNMTR